MQSLFCLLLLFYASSFDYFFNFNLIFFLSKFFKFFIRVFLFGCLVLLLLFVFLRPNQSKWQCNNWSALVLNDLAVAIKGMNLRKWFYRDVSKGDRYLYAQFALLSETVSHRGSMLLLHDSVLRYCITRVSLFQIKRTDHYALAGVTSVSLQPKPDQLRAAKAV